MTNLYESDDFYAMRNLDNPQNFQILRTWQRNMKVKTITGDQPRAYINFYHKFKRPVRVKYLGTGNAVTDADRNGLFLIFMTNGGATTSPTISMQTRLTFKDI